MPNSPAFLTKFPGNTETYRKLLDQVRSGQAVGLVGAGVSAGLYLLWPQLIRHFADVARKERGIDDAAYNFWLDRANADPQDVVSLIKTQIGDSRYREILREVFKPVRGSDGNPFTSTQAALMQLPFRGFVTTNYESGLIEARTKFKPAAPAANWATWKNTAIVADWITGDVFDETCPVLFIHGCYQDLDTIVLNSEDYETAYNGQLLQFFHTLWTKPGLVFVGFGFSDPWWSFLAQRVLQQTGVQHARGPSHVAIVGLGPGESYTEQHRELFRKRYNTHLVFYQIKALDGGGQDHGELLDILAQLKESLGQNPNFKGDGPSLAATDALPKPPEPYKPHPYLLLDSQRGLIGRKAELKRLDEWVEGEANGSSTIRTMHAIGGTGKSSLSWVWFDTLFQSTKRPVGGGMWYSFYEKDASFSDFIHKAYQYFVRPTVSPGTDAKPNEGDSPKGVHALINPLLKAIDAADCVVVLDGFERLLMAYARLDALHRVDENSLQPLVVPPDGEMARESRDAQLRRSVDPDVELFLACLKQHKHARYLITSRIVPAVLQNDVGGDQPGCTAVLLDDLRDEDVLDVFRAYGVRGDDALLLAATRPFGNHALLVKLLAKTVVRDRSALGDFEAFRTEHPDFDPALMDLRQSRTHVLQFALGQLSEGSRRVLQAIAAFRSPQRYRTIQALLRKDEDELDNDLNDLEDVGLLAVDRDDRTYDLHPLVRNVVWHRLAKTQRDDLLESIQREFQEIPAPKVVKDVNELQPAIEAMNALTQLERWDDAYRLYEERIGSHQLGALCDAQLHISLLEAFLTDEPDPWPQLSDRRARSMCLMNLALAFELKTNYASAHAFHKKHNGLCPETLCPAHYARIAVRLGHYIESEGIYRRLVDWCRSNHKLESEFNLLRFFAGVLEVRGVEHTDAQLLRRMIYVMRVHCGRDRRKELWLHFSTFECRIGNAVDSKKLGKAEALAARYLSIQRKSGNTYLQIYCLALSAYVARKAENFQAEEERLRQMLQLARVAGNDEQIVEAALRLANCCLRKCETEEAKQLIDDAWTNAQLSTSAVRNSQCLVLRAQYFRLTGNQAQALHDASEAYRLAWCDGPPFAYQSGLEEARKELEALDAPIPDNLPSKKLPVDWIEVEINPRNRGQDADDGSSEPWRPHESEVERFLSGANEALGNKDGDKALKLAMEATRLDPRGEDCWTLLGKARWHLQMLDEAESDFARATQLSSASFWGHVEIGRCHAWVLGSLNRYDEALARLKEAFVGEDDLLFQSLRVLCEAEGTREQVVAQRFAEICTPTSDGAQDGSDRLFYLRSPDFYFCALANQRLGRDSDARRMFQKVVDNTSETVPQWMLDRAAAFLEP